MIFILYFWERDRAGLWNCYTDSGASASDQMCLREIGPHPFRTNPKPGIIGNGKNQVFSINANRFRGFINRIFGKKR